MGISSGASHYSLTRSGGMLGSPMYMSPEQARNAKAVDERTDVWSLSVVLWEALSGQRLWGGQSSLGELIVAICTEPDPAAGGGRALGTARAVARRAPRPRARPRKAHPQRARADRTTRRVRGRLRSRRHEPARAALSEEQRGELSLKVSLSDCGRAPHRRPGQKPEPRSRSNEIVTSAAIDGSARSRRAAAAAAAGASKSAMLAVAVLSAAIAGGSAYYFARGRGAAPLPRPRCARSTSTPACKSCPPTHASSRATACYRSWVASPRCAANPAKP